MKADFTRSTFRPLKHFTRVLVQQGRVQLDAELNEQVAMLLDYMRTLAADLIGKAGGPEGNCGFEIFPPFSSPNQGQDFQIGFGNYYVDGLLCQADFAPIPIFTVGTAGVFQVTNWDPHFELTPMPLYEVFDDTPSPALGPTPVTLTISNQKQNQITVTNANPGALNWLSGSPNPRLRRIITYLHQPDYPYLVAQGVSPTPPPLPLNTAVQIYLDVWEHAITYAQDDYIREVALGGPDTTARAKLVWQVKYTDPVTNADKNPVCMSPQLLETRFQPPNRGWLQARAKQGSQSTDPCIIAPNASYTGPENQLYRVEINRAGPAWTGPTTKDGSSTNDALAATFKWSRENGSPVYPIESGGGTLSVQLESLGRDDRFGLEEGDYVEVQDDRSILINESNDKNLQPDPVLLQVQAVDPSTMTVTLAGTPDPSVGKYPALHPILRRWDQRAGDPQENGLTLASDNAAYVQEGEDVWWTLEDGVQISFQPADPVQNPGDKAPTNWYRTGDYWLIPARTATGDVEWPKVTDSNGNFETDAAGNTIPLALPPHGITHHYAPLAVIPQNLDTKKFALSDCRGLFDNGVEAEIEAEKGPGEQEPAG